MNEVKAIIELIPPLDKKCKIAATLLRSAFTLVPLLLGAVVWAQYGWLYGVLLWMAGVFAGLIILSKLKIAYVPHNQHELPHSATAILKWYVAKELCGYETPRHTEEQPGISEAPR
ncbi:hypothetical protein NNO_1149 [Hydrogenimonas sp.]|nr:hypothetical protein NNO_1149 [Hydrogenimonas sp.]